MVPCFLPLCVGADTQLTATSEISSLFASSADLLLVSHYTALHRILVILVYSINASRAAYLAIDIAILHDDTCVWLTQIPKKADIIDSNLE